MKYLLVMLLPLGVLLTRPLTPTLVLMLGEEIRLETEPFDPRDIFRGDYVELRFAIERIPAALMESPDTRSDETAVDSRRHAKYLYVTLEPDRDRIFQPIRLTKEPPTEGVYVRGVYDPYYTWDSANVYLDYGNSLRRFYVKENTGLDLEAAARRGKVEAVAKVWKGRIVLQSVREKNNSK